MSILKRLTVLITLLLAPLTAQAFGFRWLFGGSSTSHYAPAPALHYSQPVISYPVCPTYTPPPVRLIPQPVPAPGFAVPTPAPPSSGPLSPRPAPPAPAPRDPGPPPSPSFGDPGTRPFVAPPPAPPDTLAPPKAPSPEKVSPPPEGAPPPAPVKPPMGSEPVPPTVPPPEPGVRESLSYYDAYPVAARDAENTPGLRCTVGFWNLGGHDVQVTVDGKTHRIARGSKVTVQLPRTFQWQAAGKEARRETVPPSETGLEVVIRR